MFARLILICNAFDGKEMQRKCDCKAKKALFVQRVYQGFAES